MTASARLNTPAKATLWDGAYLALKSALLEGRYAPGDRIVLRDVAEELGISLTPVRDAVNRLSAEKVLHRGSAGNGGGATVPLLTTDQFRQLMTVRSSLEPVAVAAAARLATASQLDAVESEEPERPKLAAPARSNEPVLPTSGELAIEDARKLTRDNPAAVANIVKSWINGEAPT